MKVTLQYYDVLFEEDPQVSIFNTTSNYAPLNIINKIKDFISTRKPEDNLYKNDDYLISILEIEEKYVFGTFGKIEDVSEKKLTRVRAKDSLEEGNIKNIKDFIERYTVFYYDIQNNSCITIHNPNVYGFKTQFAKFLMHHFKLSSIYNINVINKINDSIPQKIKQLNKFSKISYKYSSDKMPENEFLSIKEISNIKNNQIRSASVELYLEPNSNYEESTKLLSETDKYINHFDTFKIHTEELTVDVVEKILSKKIDIELNEDDLNDLNLIKKELIKNLDNY